MTTVYVTASGSASSPDPTNPATPWTLAKAIQATAAGDTVLLNDNANYGTVTVTSQTTSRASKATIQPASGKNPKLGQVSLSNVNMLKFTGLRMDDSFALGDSVFDLDVTSMTFLKGAAEKVVGGINYQGSGGGRWLFEGNTWSGLTWVPSVSTDQNGPTCIIVNPTTQAPIDITVRANVYRNLIGFDGMQFLDTRNSNSPVTADWYTSVVIEDNVMDNVGAGSTAAHADPMQFGGYHSGLIIRRNAMWGGTRGIIIQPNTRVVNSVTTYPGGRVDDAIIENNVVLCEGPNASSFALALNNAWRPVIRHNTFLNASVSTGNTNTGCRFYLSRPGNQFNSKEFTFVNNVVDQIHQFGTITYTAKGNNVIGLNATGSSYSFDASDTLATVPFIDRPNAVQPRELGDFVVSSGAARNGADTTAAYTVSDDARGLARSGTKDIGALDADASTTGVPADTTAPTGTMTGPVMGTTVTAGAVLTLSCTAQDPSSGVTSTGVASVQFQYRAVGAGSYTSVGAADTVAPYLTSLDTTGFSAGDYEVSAVVTDGASNAATLTPVVFTVAASVPADPADPGAWGVRF